MGEVAALSWAALFALNTVFMRFGSSRMNLFWLNALRCFCAMLSTATFLAATRGLAGLWGMPLETFLWLLFSTLIAYAIGDTLYYRSSQLIGVSRAMPLSNGYPIVSVALAVLLLGEPMSWRLAAGTVIILAGAYLVALPGGKIVAERRLPLPPGTGRNGVLMALAAALFWGASVICDKLALRAGAVDLVAASFLRLLLGTLFLFAFAGSRGFSVNWRKLGPRFLLLVALVGATIAAGSPFLWLFAIQQAGAAKAALLASTAPLFGLVFSAILLGERATRLTAAGAVLTILGVWLIV